MSNKNKEVIIIGRDTESAEKIKEKVGEVFPKLNENDAIKIYTKSFNDLISKVKI